MAWQIRFRTESSPNVSLFELLSPIATAQRDERFPDRKNGPLNLAKCQAAVAELYMTSRRHWEIAEKLGADPGTDLRDPKVIHVA